jgi:hypothetical protein
MKLPHTYIYFLYLQPEPQQSALAPQQAAPALEQKAQEEVHFRLFGPGLVTDIIHDYYFISTY